MGDPVRSRPTPFIESLYPARTPPPATLDPSSDAQSSTRAINGEDAMPQAEQAPSSVEGHRNYFLRDEDLEKSLEYSRWLTEPLLSSSTSPSPSSANVTGSAIEADTLDPADLDRRRQRHAEQHANAVRALAAITSLQNANTKDRTRVNIQRCIAEFGRHNTDAVLRPKPASIPLSSSSSQPEDLRQQQANPAPTPRIGPDTGSPEVQVAILTTKITVLARNLQRKDKHNKRNLRLLVHRRQKLLKYLREKERGGPRWQNLVEKLGINDAMWRGEITL